MSCYKVEICGVNTAKLPLLSNEEKERLFSLILKGDMDAREEYIKGNLRLVLSVIQRFAGSQENIDDLFQIGCIGLIKAIDNFDITQNVKFSTLEKYAAICGIITPSASAALSGTPRIKPSMPENSSPASTPRSLL